MKCQEQRGRGPGSSRLERATRGVQPARWRAGRLLRSALLWCWVGPRIVGSQLVPQLLEMDVVLAPSDPYHVRVGIGQAKFLRFSCMGGPADVVISLSTYAERADPLLFLSLNPTQPPSFQRHDASSFGQWQEDAVGDHYVIAKAVSPRGGILGLVNMRHFAGEELDGILSIHCTFIVAFDTLFWDHLRSSAVCPLGGRPEAHTFCSGHGHCGKHGVCECDGDFTGAACEHSKVDVVVAAEGRYEFRVATGHYQYFRVRVPPRFPGGYLEVDAHSRQPLVILVRNDDLPTKRNFELSNFDDWINSRNISVLQYKVMSADGIPGVPGPYGGLGRSAVRGMPGGEPRTTDRRLAAVPGWLEGGEVGSWPQLFRRAGYSVQGPTAEIHGQQDAVPRLLDDGNWRGVHCPKVTPALSSPACGTPSFLQCQLSCMRCVSCVKGDKDKDQGCTRACNACVSPGCINSLALCAGNMSCMGHEAVKCEAGCGRCMACFDSNDRDCSGCHCCKDCLPLAAKCSVMLEQPAEYNRFVFVGIYNHPRYRHDRAVVKATATISLTADPAFEREQLPSSWVGDLWDPFHDIRSLEITQRQVYPEGEQYIYDVDVKNSEALRLEVRLYHDRMTLLHIQNHAQAKIMELRFLTGPNITHVLTSTHSAPKTFFDFDKVHTQEASRKVSVLAGGKQSLWCAVFGAADGFVTINVKTFADSQSAPLPPVGFALVCVFALLLGIMVLAVIYGGAQSIGERLGMDPSVPLSDRLASLVDRVRPHNPHESTASLTRTGSLSGYVGSDVIDRSVEDQYLHRGGIGDDGI